MLDRIGMVFRFSTTPCTRCKPVTSSSREIRNFMRFSPLLSPSRTRPLFPSTHPACQVLIRSDPPSRISYIQVSLALRDVIFETFQCRSQGKIRVFRFGNLLTRMKDG